MRFESQRIGSFGASIFSEISALSRQFEAVNLGQGFPDFDGPEEIRKAAESAMAKGRNQYAISHGEAKLRSAIAEHARRFYGQTLHSDTEITVTSGATEALFCTAFAFLEPGDEVIVFEPFYDSYLPGIEMAGGIPVPVTLHAPDFRFRAEELIAAFSAKTKAIYINTPHNPTGTVFNREELELIARLCQEYDVLAICDEVYEHIVFSSARHIRLATIAGMEDRTLTISSGGKTFSLTGWKIGWAIAAPALSSALRKVHQFCTFASATPFQYAIAEGLLFEQAYFDALAKDFQERRDFLLDVVEKSGLTPKIPEGSYFILAGIENFPHKTAEDFARFMIQEIGVAVIPPESFYIRRERGEQHIRFCFSKKWETLHKAAERMAKLPTFQRKKLG